MLVGHSGNAFGNPTTGGGSPVGPPNPRATSVQRTLIALTIFTFLAIFGQMEAAAAPPWPLTAVVSCIVVFALLCVTQLELAFLLVIGVTPFSIERSIPGTGSALQVPTEPMLFVALAAWGVRSLVRVPRRIAQPGLMTALLMALAAMCVSIAVSAYRVESLKATLNASWYAAFGVFVLNNFAERGRLKLLPLALLVPGTAVALYSMICVMLGHFEPVLGYWWAMPFFTDHGTFAAYLSFVCALAMGLAIELTGGLKLLFSLIAIVSGAEVILSTTRGAWMGLAGLAVFLVAISWKRLARAGNLGWAAMGLVALLGVFVVSGAVNGLERRSQSITSAPDLAALERVNRWAAGFSMFRSAPVAGVGFGAYPSAYVNHRRFSLGTEQSTERMGVHSEYLKILAETGLLGAITAAIVFVFVARMALRGIRNAGDPYIRGLAVGLSGGLVTYGVHAVVNNYMVYDKLAVPVWMAVGALGAIDTLSRK